MCPFSLRRLALFAFVVLVPFSVLEAEEKAAPSRITATDLFKIKQLEAPAISPDGRWIVYVVRSVESKPDAKDDWTYHTHLWLVASDGSTPARQLTRGSNNNSGPQWSPDGSRIVFTRTLEKEKPQLYVLELAGGEAQQFTRLETGAGSARWSPDGKKILFTSSLTQAQIRDVFEKRKAGSAAARWNEERPGRKANDTANWKLKTPAGAKAGGEKPKDDPKAKASADGTVDEAREWLAKNEAENNPRVMTRPNFLAEADLQPDLGFAQIHVMDASAEAEPKLVFVDFDARNDVEWMADSRHIVCVTNRDASLHPDRDRMRSIVVFDTVSDATRVLLARPDESYGSPQASPDGKWIAFTVQTGGPFSFEQPRVAVVPVEGGEPRVLSAALDRSAQNPTWDPESRHLYFTAASEGGFPLFRVGVDGGNVEKLTHEATWGIRAFAVGPQRIAQVVTEPANPYELHVADESGKSSRGVTKHNSGWLAERKLAAYEEHSFVNDEGMRVQFWTIKPTDFDASKKYPLLVQIHGGPSAMWGPGENSMWHEFQWYAARGYAVVFSNPRGSGGYGRDFQRANHRDWGAGPASDVLRAADFAARLPHVDAGRQVLTGGSYGGYLTAWIVAHDHRFKAAVAQRGVYDLVTFFGEGNAWFLVSLYFGGYPWEAEVRGVLERESPLTYVQNIRTPLLIQHGDVDFRTGVIQSQMLYKSLKQLERPVEYVRYPRANHEMSRSGEPKHRLDSLLRYEEFFSRFLQ